MWTSFWDMHSGGKLKLSYKQIFIQGDEDTANGIFYRMFHRDPEHVTCPCCGPDFSVEEWDDILQATGFHRHCGNNGEMYLEEPQNSKYARPYMTLEEYMCSGDALFILTEPLPTPSGAHVCVYDPNKSY